MPDIPNHLRTRSLSQLRGIAQSFGVTDIFSKNAAHLIQEIGLKQQNLVLPPPPPIPKPEYDARLMDKPPAKRGKPTEIVELLAPYIERGLHFNIDENGETWTMQHNKKTDSGTMRMPPRTILTLAERVMR